MAREILKVRKVGGTLVVTLTQGILEQIPLSEGDRVLMEAVPPKRILIMKEEAVMPSTRRLELEVEALEARRRAVESDINYKVCQQNRGMPVDEGMQDDSVADLALHGLARDRDNLAAEIAEKRLQLFELEGGSLSTGESLRFIRSGANVSYDSTEYSQEGSLACLKNCGQGTYVCLVSRNSPLDQQRLVVKREQARKLITADCPFHENTPEFAL